MLLAQSRVPLASPWQDRSLKFSSSKRNSCRNPVQRLVAASPVVSRAFPCPSSLEDPLQVQSTNRQRFWARKKLSTGNKQSRQVPRALPSQQACDEPPFTPTPEQQSVIDAALAGRNLFITGMGAADMLPVLERALRGKYDSLDEYRLRVAVVAMTGAGAFAVGGTTLHALLGLGRLKTFQDTENMFYDEHVLWPLYNLRTLIVAEAHLIAELWQVLDTNLTVARKRAFCTHSLFIKGSELEERLKQCDQPYGGLQLILCGDFYEAPPPPENDLKE